MGCVFSAPKAIEEESEIERSAHERRKTQHLIQNLVHEEYRLKVDEVRRSSNWWQDLTENVFVILSLTKRL